MGLLINRDGTNSSLKKFIQVLSSGINLARVLYYSIVSDKKFELKFNAQTIYMSEYLNQVYDPIQKRIYIINDSTLGDVFIFRNSEIITALEESYIFRTAETITADEQIYLDSDNVESTFDFQVMIPSALSSLATNEQFTGSINKYKLPDKSFEILTY